MVVQGNGFQFFTWALLISGIICLTTCCIGVGRYFAYFPSQIGSAAFEPNDLLISNVKRKRKGRQGQVVVIMWLKDECMVCIPKGMYYIPYLAGAFLH